MLDDKKIISALYVMSALARATQQVTIQHFKLRLEQCGDRTDILPVQESRAFFSLLSQYMKALMSWPVYNYFS